MPDRWQTYPVEFKGGLISNLSPLQHGAAMPGSARVLNNFEPSIEGGYRRIEGYEKYNTNEVTGENVLLGVEFYRGAAIVARAQTSGNPKLFVVSSGSAAHVDLSTSIRLGANVSRVRFASYNFNGTEKLFIVDGVGYPLVLENLLASGLSQLSSSNGSTDLEGASHVTVFKDHIFAANGRNIIFSAPFEDDDFTTANGAGIIDVGSTVTGLVVFREQLIIFSESKINRLVGNSVADFQVQPIATDIGCIAGETIQEISGDVVFLAPDGLRTIAGTERNQDFSLATISKPIQKELVSLTSVNSALPSVVIREKSQYRMFGYTAAATASSSKGIIGTQLQEQQGQQINWAETTGIKAYATTSKYVGKIETILFVNDDGYVYQMESGNNFDGSDIIASFSTPYFPITDPRTRKTIYRATIYSDPQGSVDLDFNLKYDLSAPDVIEPATITFENASSSPTTSIYGSVDALFGTSRYSGETLQSIFNSQTQGSGFTVSLQFESRGTNPPFSLDTTVLEYGQYGRR